MSESWRWPLLIRVYVPPSRGDLADRLKVSVGDLVVEYGSERELGLLCVMDSDHDVVSEGVAPLDWPSHGVIEAAIALVGEHPAGPLSEPHRGLSIEHDESANADGFDGDTWLVRLVA